MKKILVLAVALLAIGLTAVQAQTRQQQQELEQIARRSVNGLSTQDRQRVVSIMTDVFVSQGMSRQQAAALAEANADNMFTTDVGEMSAAERRQFEEQEERLRYFEGAEQRQQEQERRLAEEEEQRRIYPGDTRGWPVAQLQERGFANLQQPTGTQSSYDGDANSAGTIYLTGANANTLQALKRQIERITGRTMEGSRNRFSVMYRQLGDVKFGSQFYINIELSGTQITISFSESAA
jgi:hypothetical protein